MTSDDTKHKGGLSRRDVLKGAGAATIAGGAALLGAPHRVQAGPGGGRGGPPSGSGSGNGSGDLGLVNGKFVDGRGEVASAMTIKNGRITNVGQLQALGPDAQVINLRGRTVIPGLVNAHVHHIRAGNNPGHEARHIETAFSVQELQEVIARRTETVPPGEFITCRRGWNHTQFVTPVRPTKADLDAAAPNHPVFIAGVAGRNPTGAVTNSLGQAFFEDRGIAVDDITGQLPEGPAFSALQAEQTLEQRLRQNFDNNAWTLNLGVTTVLDALGGGTQPFFRDIPFELWRQERLKVRHRLYLPAGSPEVVQTRVDNMFREMGDDLFRAGGFGETIGTRSQIPETFEPVARVVAEHGWKIQNHTDFFSQVDEQIEAFESISADHRIDDLRWQLIHVFETRDDQLQSLRDLGVGVNLENERYLDLLNRGPGPSFRQIVDSGINIGIGTDGSNFAPNNPWNMMFYMTTGINVHGEPENADQAISRLEALRLFTEGSAFQSFDDDKLGAFEVGKTADLAVLSEDFLTVPDDRIRRIRSVLTVLGGEIVHEGDEPQYSDIDEEFEVLGRIVI